MKAIKETPAIVLHRINVAELKKQLRKAENAYPTPGV